MYVVTNKNEMLKEVRTEHLELHTLYTVLDAFFSSFSCYIRGSRKAD